MSKDKPKKHPVNLKLDTEEYELLTKLAAEDGRSRTNYVLVALRRQLYTSRRPSDSPDGITRTIS